jgi:Rieske Fe-S protein
MEGNESASRRAVLAGAGGACAAAVLAGCATYGAQPAPPAAAPAASGAAGGGGAAAGKALAQTADIPVGGGKIFADQRVVVTQPQQGTFKAFSAVCTHQGCTVGDVSGGTINCPCHGSKFKVADGSVANGPATAPLASVNVKVDGTGISLA